MEDSASDLTDPPRWNSWFRVWPVQFEERSGPSREACVCAVLQREREMRFDARSFMSIRTKDQVVASSLDHAVCSTRPAYCGRNVRVPAMDQPPEITRKSRSSQSSWASFDIDDTPLSAVELHHAHLRTRIAADIDICDT